MTPGAGALRVVLGSEAGPPCPATVRLVATSCRGSLKRVLGDRDQRHRLLASRIHWDRILIAYHDDRPVGFAAFRYAGRGPVALSPAMFIEAFGLLPGLARYVAVRLAEQRERRYPFFLYSLKVTRTARRGGVATALLEALERHAASQGHAALDLEVYVENAPARHLYERRGYAIRRTVSLPWLRLTAGHALYHMSATLRARP